MAKYQENRNVFGANLQRLRKLKGLNQKELGDFLGVGANTISNYENGVSNPNPKNLEIIIRELGTTYDELNGKNVAAEPKAVYIRATEESPEAEQEERLITSLWEQLEKDYAGNPVVLETLKTKLEESRSTVKHLSRREKELMESLLTAQTKIIELMEAIKK